MWKVGDLSYRGLGGKRVQLQASDRQEALVTRVWETVSLSYLGLGGRKP